MQEILNIFDLSPQYVKIITFIWNVIKCTILFVVCIRGFKWFVNKIFNKIIASLDSPERQRQFLTVKSIIIHSVEVIIFGIYILNMLFLFGIDVRPLLATAGVLGIAIGFGSKRFVEDIITGLTILLEGQIRVGDYVEINNMSGFVERITLPLINIRSDKTGAVYFIRCGSIDSIINHTMHYAYATFEFDVAYKENIDHVFSIIKKSFAKLSETEEYKKKILNDIEIFGLDQFRESSLSIKCRIKTQPKEQWIIKRTFNKIIKEQFDAANIEIPFNQIVVSTPCEAVRNDEK